MINYDIGILSFWNVPNYGTFAQEYALQKVISSMFENQDVRQIAHLNKLHYNFYYNRRSYYRSFPIFTKSFWKSIQYINNNEILKKQKTFIDAYQNIPHTEEITDDNIQQFSFENIILGSDIIWDFSQSIFNHDELLFGNKFFSKSINSYAASFGVVNLTMEIPEYVRFGIKKLDQISVRDENSADLVKYITGKRPEIVLDPVWLWDFSNDKSIKIPSDEGYILVYGQAFTNKYIENLIKYAKDNHYSIIVLDCNNDRYSWCDKLIKQSELNPLDWIGYFKGAAAVATSTFHGLTFALVFNKKIAFCKTDFIMAKARLLIEQLGLSDVFKDREDIQKMLNYDWNYDKINRRISEQKEVSRAFLKRICK